MAKIFEKKIEIFDIDNRIVRLPTDSNWGELPSVTTTLVVTDEGNRTWNFNFSKSGRSSLGGTGWRDFVRIRGIVAGKTISLYKQDGSYTIEVRD